MIATLPPGQPHPNPSETRTVSFPREPNATQRNYPAFNASQAAYDDAIADVSHHIATTLSVAGLRVRIPDFSSKADLPTDISLWDIDRDNSIRPFDGGNGYSSIGIEVRSPAFFYNGDSLREVGFAMGVLTSMYVTSLNQSTGLHVHVGNGMQSFTFDTMRRLIAFLYAFEPQISSLHPQHRYDSVWAQSLRYGSSYVAKFLNSNGSMPRPLEAVAHYLKSASWDDLLGDCRSVRGGSLAYRFDDLQDFKERHYDPHAKLTVEFRQHAGSVDGQEIQNWVRTVVGIVGFVVDSDPRALKGLFSLVGNETLDAENGATVEPVLAETEFTIIDLLRHMDLNIPAAYYQQKGLHKIRHGGEYVDERLSKLGRSTLDLLNQRQLREAMESQQRDFSASAATSGFMYNPHDTSGMQLSSPSPTDDSPNIQQDDSWVPSLRVSLAAGPSGATTSDDEEERGRSRRPRSRHWRRSKPTSRGCGPLRQSPPLSLRTQFAQGQSEAIDQIRFTLGERTACAPKPDIFLDGELQDISLFDEGAPDQNNDERTSQEQSER